MTSTREGCDPRGQPDQQEDAAEELAAAGQDGVGRRQWDADLREVTGGSRNVRQLAPAGPGQLPSPVKTDDQQEGVLTAAQPASEPGVKAVGGCNDIVHG